MTVPLTFTNVLNATLYSVHLSSTISSDLIARQTVAVARTMNSWKIKQWRGSWSVPYCWSDHNNVFTFSLNSGLTIYIYHCRSFEVHEIIQVHANFPITVGALTRRFPISWPCLTWCSNRKKIKHFTHVQVATYTRHTSLS